MADHNGNITADETCACLYQERVEEGKLLEHGDGESDDKLPPLTSYDLSNEEHRRAFLFHYCWVGQPALFEAVSHVWASLAEPREARCTLMGVMSGTGGTGKKALVLTLQKLLDQALAIDNPIPDASAYDSLDEWHEASMAAFAAEEQQLRELCARYSAILDGAAAASEACEAQMGSVIEGPWQSM